MKRVLLLLSLLFTLSSQAQLIINEVLYDPSNAGLDGDANGDGVYDQEQDSFIEFINTGTFNFDASGLQIWDDTVSGSLKYTVTSGTLVPPNGALVVFGGGTPTGSFGGALVQVASGSSNGLNLNNNGEVIVIKDANGNPILSFNTDALSDNPNESYTRNPDITGLFEQHTDNTPLKFSPGTRIDGTPFDTVLVSAPIPRDVTFRADLSQLGTAVTAAYVSGDFNSQCTNCDPLSDPDGDDIWEGTVTVTSDTVLYRILADATAENLSSAGSCAVALSGTWLRSVYVPMDTTLPAYCWQSCSVCLPLATSISVNGAGGVSAISVNAGTLQMEATILPSTANQQVSWSVDDPSLASIDAQGLLTAIDNGTVRVTGATTDGSNLSGFVDVVITNQTIGLSEAIAARLQVYPNPSTGLVHIAQAPAQTQIRVSDFSGRTLRVEDLTDERIDLRALPQGLYLLELSGSGWTVTRRIVVAH